MHERAVVLLGCRSQRFEEARDCPEGPHVRLDQIVVADKCGSREAESVLDIVDKRVRARTTRGLNVRFFDCPLTRFADVETAPMGTRATSTLSAPNYAVQRAEMSKPIVELTETQLTVAPGGRISTVLRFRNRSQIVGEFRITIPSFCEPSRWVSYRVTSPKQGQPTRPFVNVSFLKTQQEADVELVFEPPDDPTTPSGPLPFVVAIDARDRGNESTSVEGVLDVTPTPSVDTRLLTDRPSARSRGRYRVGAVNTGNAPVEIFLNADYEPGTTSVAWAPESLQLQPRQQGEFLVELRARSIRPAGKTEKLKATLTPRAKVSSGAEFPAGQPHQLDFEQKPWLTKPILAVGALAVVGGAALFVLNRSGTGTPDGPPPPQPTQIAASSTDSDAVNVSLLRNSRAVDTEVAVIDCSDANPLEPNQLSSLPFGTEAAADVDISAIQPGIDLCVVARSVGSDGLKSAWTDPVKFERPDQNLASPVITLDGDDLVFEPVPQATGYEVVVDNAPRGMVAGSPFGLRTLQLPVGSYQIALRALAPGERFSVLSEPVTYKASAPLGDTVVVDSPWVLLHFSNRPIDGQVLNSIQGLVASLADEEFRARAPIITDFQLAAEAPSGEPYWYDTNSTAEPIDLGGRHVVGDTGGNLSEAQVQSYCSSLLAAIAERMEPGLAQVVCVPFDGKGNQLTVPPPPPEN